MLSPKEFEDLTTQFSTLENKKPEGSPIDHPQFESLTAQYLKAPSDSSSSIVTEGQGPGPEASWNPLKEAARSTAGVVAKIGEGLANVPTEVATDVTSLVLRASRLMGLSSEKDFRENMKALEGVKQDLKVKLPDNAGPLGDLSRFNDVSNAATQVGAFGAEALAGNAVGKAALSGAKYIPSVERALYAGDSGSAMARIFGQAAQEGISGATSGALMSADTNPDTSISSAIGVGGALGAVTGATLGAGSEVLSKLLRGSRGIDDAIASAKDMQQAEAKYSPPTPAPLAQRLGTDTNATLQTAQKALSQDITSQAEGVSGSIYGLTNSTARNAVRTFREAEKAAKIKSDANYKAWLDATKTIPVTANSSSEAAINILKKVAPESVDSANQGIKVYKNLSDFTNVSGNSKLSSGKGLPEIDPTLKNLLINLSSKTPKTTKELYNSLAKIKTIGDTIAKKGSAKDLLVEGERLQDVLEPLKAALDADLQNAAKLTGTEEAFQIAKSYWENNVLALRKVGLNYKQSTTNLKNLVDFLKEHNNTDAAKTVLKAIGPEGEQAVKSAMIGNLLFRRTSATKGINVDAALKEYQEMVANHSMLFKPVDKQNMKNIATLLINLKKTTGLDEGMLSKGFNFILNQPVTQNFLLTAAKLPPLSKKAEQTGKMLATILRTFQTGMAGAIAKQAAEAPISEEQK